MERERQRERKRERNREAEKVYSAISRIHRPSPRSWSENRRPILRPILVRLGSANSIGARRCETRDEAGIRISPKTVPVIVSEEDSSRPLLSFQGRKTVDGTTWEGRGEEQVKSVYVVVVQGLRVDGFDSED